MRRPLVERFGPAVLGVVSVVLTSVGMTGVGDAPDPHELPEEMAAHFVSVSDAVVRAAPLGYVGALGIGAFLLLLARPARRRPLNTILVWILVTSIALTSRVSRGPHRLRPSPRPATQTTTTKAGSAT